MLKRGSTIGILGGGQLGRMMAVAAAQLGYRCIGYSPEGDNVAAEVCEDFFTNDWDDKDALAAFAARCDVVTWEFENVPVGTVDDWEWRGPTDEFPALCDRLGVPALATRASEIAP